MASARPTAAPRWHSIARLSLAAIPSVNVDEGLTAYWAIAFSFPKLQKTLAFSTSHLTPFRVIKPVDPNICGPLGSVFTLTALTTSLKSINTVARVRGVFGVHCAARPGSILKAQDRTIFAAFSSIPESTIDFAAA